MKIKTTNPNLRQIKLPWMDEPVAFNAAHIGVVDDDVGERLVEEVSDIERRFPNSDS